MSVRIYHGDCRRVLGRLEAESVQCVVTSPPYWGLRDYGEDGQFGLEPTPEEHVENMVAVFREVRRVMRADGTLWLNYGDSYAASGPPGGKSEKQDSNRGSFGTVRRNAPVGLKQKDLVGMPWRVAFALQADGWYLRSDIIWAKPNPMPESVTDRPTKSHEHIFLMAKAERYFYDADAVREPRTMDPESKNSGSWKRNCETSKHDAEDPAYRYRPGSRPKNYFGHALGRNLRDVWTISTAPFRGAHFATFPPKLVEPCIKAGCPEGGTVLDPFGGAGTVGLVADRLGRNAVLIELNEEYAAMAERRIRGDCPMFADVEKLTGP